MLKLLEEFSTTFFRLKQRVVIKNVDELHCHGFSVKRLKLVVS